MVIVFLGLCLMRFSRTQNRHVKIRVRLVFEAVLNEQFYLSNEYLSLGVQLRLPARPNLRAPSTTEVSRYCLYSGEDYVTGYRMSLEEMHGVYHYDIVKIGRKGNSIKQLKFPKIQFAVCTLMEKER